MSERPEIKLYRDYEPLFTRTMRLVLLATVLVGIAAVGVQIYVQLDRMEKIYQSEQV